jgi:6-pyruvoyltetrahydropterin/6-carboxytetrahydropterin synthase
MNQKIRLTKIFSFEMAHALSGYDGACSNIHGHSYELHVTVIGTPLYDNQHPKNGMVMDFKDLKKIVKQKVIDRFDHALILKDDKRESHEELLSQYYQKVEYVAYQPSCEMMLLDIAEKISQPLPPGVSLHHLKLYETRSSFAEWYASDQVK